MNKLSWKSLAVIVGLSFLTVFAVRILNTSSAGQSSEDSQEEMSAPRSEEPQERDHHEEPEKAPVSPLANPEVVATAERLSEGDFVELADTTLSALPVLEDFKNLKPKEVHLMPGILRTAGEKLGAVSQVLHGQPELARQGLDFYRSCFEKGDLPEQLRALCFANYRNLNSHVGNRELDWNTMVPPEVLSLADKIPRGW